MKFIEEIVGTYFVRRVKRVGRDFLFPSFFFFFFLDTQSGMERILISKFHSLRIPTDANENIFLDIPGKIR